MLTTTAEPEKWPDPLLCFREEQQDRVEIPGSDPAEEADAKIEKGVLCRACRSIVTQQELSVAIHGKHMHTFFNPAGIVYEIRCFSKAGGCVRHGRPTDEFTWFAGYTWEYSLCAVCFDHLGWFYNSSDNFFFGLINSKLIVD